MVIPVTIFFNKKKIRINCLIDGGSNTTFVTLYVVRMLGLPTKYSPLTFNGMGDKEGVFPRRRQF